MTRPLTAEAPDPSGTRSLPDDLPVLAERPFFLVPGRRDWAGIGIRVFERQARGEVRWTADRHLLLLALGDPGWGGIAEDGGPTRTGRAWPGALLFYPQGLRPRVWSEPTRWALAQLDPALFRAPALGTRAGQALDLQGLGAFGDPLIEEAMRALIQEAAVPGAGMQLLVDGLANLIALTLARHMGALAEPAAAGLDPGLLRRVLEYIEAHLGEELSLTQLAAIACLSPAHFSRSFKRAVGLGPHRYVVTRRIERAKALLRPGGPPLAGVAAGLGFGDQAHFTRTFRAATGTTPGRFRASLC